MLKNQETAFLGGVFPKDIYGEVFRKSKTGMQNAANNLQWSIIEGLDYNLFKPLTLLNFMFVGSYPSNYSDVFIKSFTFSHTKRATDYNYGFLNFTGIKQLVLKVLVKNSVKKWAIKHKTKNKILFVYSAQPYFLEAIKHLKKEHANLHVCLILPDLPIYMGLNLKENSFRTKYIKAQGNKIHNFVEYIDSFVFLTSAMANYLNIHSRFIVVEGMAKSQDINNLTDYPVDTTVKTVVYTGSLAKKYGILELIEAFSSIKSTEYRLVICGDGEARVNITQAASYDSRIVYKGLLPSNEVLNIQRGATVLINPRRNIDDYTKYSFPSKIIEYMSVGKPVICFKLDGIPSEYDDYLTYIKEDVTDGMADKIVEICELSQKELDNIGNKNRRFIVSYKNNNFQTMRILKMISSLEDE